MTTIPLPLDWLLDERLPWVRRQALVRLAGHASDDPEVTRAHEATLAHPFTAGLLAGVAAWPGPPLKTHKDAKHPLHQLHLLVDMGLTMADAPIPPVVDRLMAHQGDDGAFQTMVQLPTRFGGSGVPEWAWMLCDAPLVLEALLAFGATGDAIDRAIAHVAALSKDMGWGCVTSIPKMRGPGRKDDPCPYATMVCLRALSRVPAHHDSPETRRGVAMLLDHWEHQKERKHYLFGVGTDFRKPKYPRVWYDIVGVLEVTSRFTWAREDPRLREMAALLATMADDEGRYKPGSVYMAYKAEDFGQKRGPSQTLTLAVAIILRRLGMV